MRETVEQLREVAVQCADTPAWALPDDELLGCLATLLRAGHAMTAAKLHLIRQIETRDLPATHHATSTATWLREHHHIALPAARRLVHLARAVDQHPDVDHALTAGHLTADQAAVIDACLTHLPVEAGTATAAKAESILIGWATDFDPHALQQLGTRILAHVAPELADRADAAALAREEARARADRTFTLTRTGDGRTRLTGWLDAEAAATVTAALDPLCAPVAGDDRTAGQRRADALTDISRLALATTELPVNGGDRPQLTITIDYEQLRRTLGPGLLDNGEHLTPTQVRRLACDAQLLPAVLGDQGQVLDLGRTRRLITGPLRRALILRDRGCTFPGCDRPARWCDAHHIQPWLDGGSTTLDNSALLCGHHHRIIHRSDWTIRLGHDQRPEFIPPTHLDPNQHPRRNTYHHRT